jgi:hypothetical protein
MTYLAGQEVTIDATFLDQSGALVNPTTVTLKVGKRLDSRSIQTLSASVTMTNTSTGKYRGVYTLPEGGQIVFELASTGAAADRQIMEIYVAPPEVWIP